MAAVRVNIGAGGTVAIDFNVVASKPPRPADVVEPVTCVLCVGRFYRVRPELAPLGEKVCPRCMREIELRAQACGGTRQ